MSAQENKQAVVSGGAWLAVLLVAAMIAAALYRFSNGLGAVTNLSDEVPWGLWIGVDVLAGVALAAGGFTIAGAVYIFNMKKYKPVARAAVLTAFAGYVVVSIGILFDIGKPMTLWHPLVMWQPHSIMFEVVVCVVLYTTVLALEFAGPFLEGTGSALAKTFTSRKVMVPLSIAAITLSFLHQSSLGALFLLMPSKLNHLWWTTMLPYNFFVSAIAAGLAMVSFEYVIASSVFKHECDMDILRGLAKGTAIALLVYFLLRVGDIMIKGNMGLIFADGAGKLFMLEMALVLIPMIMLFLASSSAQSAGAIFVPQMLVLVGIVLNRLDILFLVQLKDGASYSPSFVELIITLGLISAIVVAYRAAAIKLPIASPVRADN
nr:polysulfide reductase NrfD [Desulfobulbaceae bacterium]